MKHIQSAVWVLAVVALVAVVPAAAAAPPLVFNVRDYGAVGNGTTDDTLAIRKAQAAAEAAATPKSAATIYLPAGTYAVCPQPGDTPPGGSKFFMPVFVALKGNVTWKGDGADKTLIKGFCAGLKNPATTWTETKDPYFKIARFGMFATLTTKKTGPVAGTLRWEGLSIDGQGPYTGNATVGGVRATGDGWDMTHKGFQFDGNQAIDAVEIVNCRVVNWRGEAVYAGGSALKSMLLSDTKVGGCNASAVSCSTALVMDRCQIGGPDAADQVYNGLENFEIVATQKTVITNSLIQCAPTAAKARGSGIAWLGVPGASLTVQKTTFQYCQYGVLFSDLGHNAAFTDVTFTGCVNGSIASGLGLYPKLPRGFSKIAFTDCTFDGGSGFVCQGQNIPDLQFTGCTVVRGNLLSGTFGKCDRFTATKTTIKTGASSAGTVSGTGVPLWSGTVNPTVATKVDVFDKSPQVSVAPWNELTWLNGQAPEVEGGISVELDPKGRNYPVGFTTKVYATKAGQWILKADAAKNTFTADLPVPVAGLMVRINTDGKWELVP